MNRLLVILIIFGCKHLVAQQLNLPLCNDYQLNEMNQLNSDSNLSFTSCKPLIQCFTSYQYNYTPAFTISKYSRLEKIVTRDHTINYKNDSVKIVADPIFIFSRGQDGNVGETYTQNTRGFRIFGNLGKKFSFETSFVENQSFSPKYIRNFVSIYKVFPGMGRTKPFKVSGFDYASSTGYISYSPNKYLNLQYGHGKLFVGNGYRSLLLSDNTFNFPHLKITFNWKNKWQYTYVTASLINLQNPERLSVLAEPLFRKKLASFHILAYRPTKKLELTLFESTIFYNDQNKFMALAFNPIPLSNALIYGLAGKNNVMIGFNAAYKLNNSILTYAQLMLDDISDKRNVFAQKTGYQLGVYYRNIANIKNLNIRAEYNTARPFSYQNQDVYQSYSHYNQSLSHPLNANFKEFVFSGNYNFYNFIINMKIIVAKTGGDSLKFNSGSKVLQSSSLYSENNFGDINMLRGNAKNLISQDFNLGYLFNPYNNFLVKIGYFRRVYPGFDSQYLYFTISANISNQYLDF